MKKNLLFLLATAAVATGCSKDSVLESDVNTLSNAISFDTYKTITKGRPVVDDADFRVSGISFGVTAFLGDDSSPYLGYEDMGAKISCVDKTWGYANPNEIAYWPKEGELNFFAYAPFDTEALEDLSISNGDMTFSYTAASDVTQHIDIMFAELQNQTNGGKVVLPFKHALTQVHFAFATKTDRLKIDIAENGIKINGLKSNGEFSLASVMSAEENEFVNGWTLSDATSSYTAISEEKTGLEYVGSASDNYTLVSDEKNALMVLPQSFTSGVELEISCKIYQELTGGSKVYFNGDDEKFAIITVPITSLNAANENVWNRGKKVTYNLLIGPSMETIQFDTTVEEWDDKDASINVQN